MTLPSGTTGLHSGIVRTPVRPMIRQVELSALTARFKFSKRRNTTHLPKLTAPAVVAATLKAGIRSLFGVRLRVAVLFLYQGHNNAILQPAPATIISTSIW